MENYKTYISNVQKQLHPELSISSDANNNINMILNILLINVVNQANKLMKPMNYENNGKLPQKKTLTVDEISTAVKLTLCQAPEISKNAIFEGEKVIKNFKKNMHVPGTFSQKAKLTFSVSKTRNAIRNHLLKANVSKEAPIFLTAVLEYICAEISEVSGNITRDRKKKVIKTLFIKLAIINDIELDELITKTLKISLTGEMAINKKAYKPQIFL